MEVSYFAGMSLFPLPLLLFSKCLLMFYKQITQAQLQWLGRMGELFMH